MNEQTNNRIREEWIDRYIKIHNDTDCCQRETVKNFIAELLKSQREEMVEKIEAIIPPNKITASTNPLWVYSKIIKLIKEDI